MALRSSLCCSLFRFLCGCMFHEACSDQVSAVCPDLTYSALPTLLCCVCILGTAAVLLSIYNSERTAHAAIHSGDTVSNAASASATSALQTPVKDTSLNRGKSQ